MCCSLQRSEDSLASSQESHVLMHCVPTVSSPQCCSRISSRVEPRRTRSWASTWRQSETTRLEDSGWTAYQAHSSSLAITACTERRRLPTPAGQPRGDDAYFFAAGHMNYARYMTWYMRNIANLPTPANNGRHTDGGVLRASPQMWSKSQFGSAALASVPTLTWP